MKIVVVDTNILFSSLRTRNSSLRRILMTKSDCLFVTPNFFIVEIFKHKERIVEKSEAQAEEILEFLEQILSKIRFEHENTISTATFIKAYWLVKEVDPKDMHFVALSLELNAQLWTRDQKLKRELIRKGFTNFFDEK